jgi:flagellar biosynthesis anti-sigma factor FlgM
MRSARQGIGAVPEIRQERVAELREQIREGRYEIDSGRIAEKMIEEALMFGVDAEP